MYPWQRQQRTWIHAVLSLCTLTVLGCAGMRLPRIDPTGEHFFVRPPVVAPPPGAAVGNVQAPPVFTDPVFPQAAAPVVTPGVVQTQGTLPVAGPAALPVPPIPQDTLSITPQRVLAPVGSEVILRAGICSTEKFLLTDQRMEWLLARDGVGEFVALGGRGYLQSPLLPWNKPQKVDNQYAIGYTATVPLTITRGTADPRDDVQIVPGQAWASVTSTVEGTSRVTAYTPTIATWAGRRVTASIYWVDVQWTFPPPSLSGGDSQVLTTTVSRQTDGLPLQGWIVRYEVADGGAALRGASSEQVVEVATGADGRASIDVTPTGTEGASTRINMQLVRPERLGGSDMPRLVIGNSSTTISWTGASTPYLPPAADSGTTIPTYPIPNSGSPAAGQPPPTQPPPPVQPTPPVATRRPVLELEIYGQDEAQVGGQSRFEVVVHNRGDGVATGIVLNDRFDEGLSHLADKQRQLEIEKQLARSLGPGDSVSDFITFDVLRAGRLCHEVTVRSSEGAETSKRACVTAAQPLPQKQPGLEVRKDGPRQRNVGEKALFTIVVKNTGEVPLTNLEIVDEYDKSLRPRPTQQGYEIVNGRIVWRWPRLEIGESKRLDVECECLTPAERACSLVRVTADGGLIRADDHCVEIRPRRADGAPAGETPTANAGGGLRLAITSFANPVRAGARATYQILIENTAAVPDEQVQLRVLFPPELTPDVSAVRADVGANLVGNELRFSPIAMIRANERLDFLIPVNVNQPGVARIVAKLSSRHMPQPIQKVEEVEILGR